GGDAVGSAFAFAGGNPREGVNCNVARVAQGGGGIPGCYRGIGTTRARTPQRAYRALITGVACFDRYFSPFCAALLWPSSRRRRRSNRNPSRSNRSRIRPSRPPLSARR